MSAPVGGLVTLKRGPPREIELTVDGETVRVPEGTTILGACTRLGKQVPTLCYLETLHPVNACRVCVVELEGARVLVPACSRAVEPGMKVITNSPRVSHSRRLVLEFLASSVDLSTTPDVDQWLGEYHADPARYGPPAPPPEPGERDLAPPGHHAPPVDGYAATVAQPIKVDNDLYVRDYSKCILCYKCVEA
ncbi:MAG: 2Fe-2S iron-sulfur cluster-binding protein, partial [Gemmatimonadota bacterium]